MGPMVSLIKRLYTVHVHILTQQHSTVNMKTACDLEECSFMSVQLKEEGLIIHKYQQAINITQILGTI